MSRLNVDQSEIAHFNESAANWWDKEGPYKALHEINPLRLGYIQSHASLQGKAVIDIGCGGGILTESLARTGAHVTGVDMSETALQTAKLHLLESGIQVDYVLSTAEEMAQEHPARYDVVTCLEMLEHVPDPSSVIQACATLVKPGGHVFFSTINRNPKAYLFAVIGAEYLLKLIPKHTHDYAKFIRPSELGEWARRAQLQVKDITGMSYNVFTKDYTLGKDVSVNYLMHTTK